MTVSVVVPLHDEALIVDTLLDRVSSVLESLGLDWEIVCVDDGSRDQTWSKVLNASRRDPRVRGLRLSRNFGHQLALTAGLQAASGGAVITMDGDLQHPPELIPELLARAREGYEVVYAIRSRIDSENRFKVASARLFYRAFQLLTALDLPHGGADFRYMSRRVVDALVAMPERHRFLRGMTRWLGFSQAVIEYDRPPRVAGASKYSLRKMIAFGLDAIIAFSSLPLRLASILGFCVSALGAVYFLYVVSLRLFTDEAVAGWASVLVVALLVGGVQLVCLGIIGQYLGRLYEQAKGRPLFLVREDTRLTSPSDDGVPVHETGQLARTQASTD